MSLTRRSFLQHAAWAAPALAALPRLAAAQETPAARPGVPPRKVVVVGAGLAGLAAAWELVQSGHDVTVLEASHRPGGRVWTLREPFADGLYAEAGAVNFGASFRHVDRYARAFNLNIVNPKPPKKPLGMVEHLGGRRVEITTKEPEWPVELAPAEKGLGLFGIYQKYLLPAAAEMGNPADPAWRLDRFTKYDQMSLAGYLRSQGASEGAIQLMAANAVFGYGWDEVSALHRLISDLALFPANRPAPPRFFEGGSDRLTDASRSTSRGASRSAGTRTRGSVAAMPGGNRRSSPPGCPSWRNRKGGSTSRASILPSWPAPRKARSNPATAPPARSTKRPHGWAKIRRDAAHSL